LERKSIARKKRIRAIVLIAGVCAVLALVALLASGDGGIARLIGITPGGSTPQIGDVAAGASSDSTETAFAPGVAAPPSSAGQAAGSSQGTVGPNPAQGGLPDGMTPPVGAITFLETGKPLSASQTYEVTLDVKGWQSSADGTLYARIAAARLMGPINAGTGAESGYPPADATDLSKRLLGLLVLSGTSSHVRGDLNVVGEYQGQLVLLPSGQGAVFVLDRVTDKP